MKTTVVTGPPCAGKSTYVAEHRGPLDVVIDLDALAHALGYPHEHLVFPTDQHPARVVALRAMLSAHKAAREEVVDATVWVIRSRPLDRLAEPHESIELDPGIEVCLSRAADRDDVEGTSRQIEEWYQWKALHAPSSSRSW